MAEVVVETEALSMRFDGVVAVKDVSLRLRRGELLCLIGPNGAGKTTFFRCLTGQHRPSAGRIWIGGRRTDGWPIHAIARLGVGIKTQVPSLADSLSVRENLWLGAQRVGSGGTGAAARVSHGQRAADERVDRLIEDLQLQAVASRPAGLLAHGVRQMVEIGVAIASDPWLLLLDEPAGGLTQAEAERVAERVQALNARMTVVVVEHDMAFVRRIARRVVVFHQGGLLADGDADTVLADPRVRAVYLGNKNR